MAKPASGTALDTGHALYTNLTAAWAMLENTGSTTADSRGSRTGTIDASVTWSTDGAGDVCLSFSDNTVAQPVSLSSSLSLAGASSWSIAWRGHLAGGGSESLLLGDHTNTADFISLETGVGIRFRSSAATIYDFTNLDFTVERDYVLAYNQGAGQLRLYVDGVEDAVSPKTVTGNDAALVITNIGNGYDVGTAPQAFQGEMSYVYVWSGRALNLTEAGDLNTDPYDIFSAAAPTQAPPPRRRVTRFFRRSS